MRCFYVAVRGTLDWPVEQMADPDSFTPSGFTCHRYVFAAGFEEAAQKAFKRVRDNLERRTGWLSKGLATLTLEAEELNQAPLRKLLRRDDRGHAFYEDNIATRADSVA